LSRRWTPRLANQSRRKAEASAMSALVASSISSSPVVASIGMSVQRGILAKTPLTCRSTSSLSTFRDTNPVAIIDHMYW
jgi:hypothetical protein